MVTLHRFRKLTQKLMCRSAINSLKLIMMKALGL
jgi:hypothetical protein